MYVVRDVFTCKPGMSRKLAELFKATIPMMTGMEGFTGARVMVDAVAGYWTVVLEADVESLAEFERQMATFGSRQDV
jgi:heme-degrading monooxygenase HmoA